MKVSEINFNKLSESTNKTIEMRKCYMKLKKKNYSRLNRANFLSIQIVANGKKAAINEKTKSSSSQTKIFRAGKRNSRYKVKNNP